MDESKRSECMGQVNLSYLSGMSRLMSEQNCGAGMQMGKVTSEGHSMGNVSEVPEKGYEAGQKQQGEDVE